MSVKNCVICEELTSDKNIEYNNVVCLCCKAKYNHNLSNKLAELGLVTPEDVGIKIIEDKEPKELKRKKFEENSNMGLTRWSRIFLGYAGGILTMSGLWILTIINDEITKYVVVFISATLTAGALLYARFSK